MLGKGVCLGGEIVELAQHFIYRKGMKQFFSPHPVSRLLENRLKVPHPVLHFPQPVIACLDHGGLVRSLDCRAGHLRRFHLKLTRGHTPLIQPLLDGSGLTEKSDPPLIPDDRNALRDLFVLRHWQLLDSLACAAETLARYGF